MTPPLTPSPILDLAGITLEVNHLQRAVRFYQQVLGLDLVNLNEARGLAEFGVNAYQVLTLWQPMTRQPNDERLGKLHARGASHLHYAWQILPDAYEDCKGVLDAHAIPWQEINLGTVERPDRGIYFFDPFGHGLELRCIDPNDERRPLFAPERVDRPALALPVVGLREAALVFADYEGMLQRLPRAYGFALAKEQDDRAFAQFTLAARPERDGDGTPQRWLYAWDPQVGLADMIGGDHATLKFYARVDEVARSVAENGLLHGQDDLGLVVRDPEGHVFEFVPVP